MVALAEADQVRSEAVSLFQASQPPIGWEWVDNLSPVNARLFAVELADAIKEATLSGDIETLVTLVAEWRATAELDTAPEVLAELRREKQRRPLGEFVSS